MPSDNGFLVAVRVYLLGGNEVVATDAFRAETEDEAINFALNTFLQNTGAIVYGKTVIVLDAMCALEIAWTQALDLSLPENSGWLESVTLFEQMLDEQDARQESNGSRAVDAQSPYGQPV